MAAQRGRLMLVQVNDGSSPASYNTVGGLRSKTITINNEQNDITTDDTAPWRHLLGDSGMRSISISGSGVFNDGAAINLIEDLAMNGSLEDFKITFENNDYIEGLFQVASYEYAGEHNGEQTFTITLESAAIPSFVRA